MSTSFTSDPTALIASQISSQLSQMPEMGPQSDKIKSNPTDIMSKMSSPNRTPSSPSKSRSFSESLPQLSPSPKFREPKKESKDDQTIASSPRTPRRPELLSRGLSLQMPPRDGMPATVLSTQTRAPLSPQLDRTHTYASPLHLLPRRSRGAEFSRACTNLHHSTLAEQSSPDSSPTITQKGLMIPRKSRTSSFIMDSPSGMANAAWSSYTLEKTLTSSSVGSVNMMGTDDSSSSESETEDAMAYTDDVDDPMLMTPQVTKSSHAIPYPFGPTATAAQSPGGWPNPFVPTGAPNFMSIQRARLRKVRSRKSSSSTSGRSSLASPGPASPPQTRSMEGSGGYFAREAVLRKSNSRRESLSLHTNDLQISSGNDSGDETGPPPTTPGVVRRAVTRRANLLPKSRQFGRIKNELFEEYAPIDSEVRREAEIIRQVRESDADYDLQPNTAHSSPSLLPTSGVAESLEDIPEDAGMSLDNTSANSTKGLFGAFGAAALGFASSRGSWSQEVQTHNTPPPTFLPRGSSSALSDDINMDSPSASSASMRGRENSSASRGGTPQAPAPPTAAEGLKKSNKRRRDDDLDINSIKRRAVSPGVSVQNSPIMSQSPSQREGAWNNPRLSREGSVSGHANGERSGSGGSLASMTPVMGPKRIGLQGMTDTNDGLMKMSIE